MYFDATSTSFLFICRLFPVGIGRHLYPQSKKAPRLSCLTLQHVHKVAALFFTASVDDASLGLYLGPRKSRIQGLATLFAVLARDFLEGFFQPPTLVGFALQSFSPS